MTAQEGQTEVGRYVVADDCADVLTPETVVDSSCEGVYVAAIEYTNLATQLAILKDNHTQTVENLGAIREAHFALRLIEIELRREVEGLREALKDIHLDGVVWPMCSHDISKVHVPMYLWNKLRAALAALTPDDGKDV